ncbi:MAG: hypothetical protein AABX85_02860 [Nanoarchaeota archaeon]
MTKENDGVFVHAPVIQRCTFSRSLQGDEAREVYKEVKAMVAKDFKNVPAFSQYFEFDEERGLIKGSNTFYGIVANEVLSKSGLWIPTIVEAKQLDAAKKLSNGVYRDFGIAVYDESNPNKEIAQKLIAEANKRGWQTPILLPFKALKLKKGGSPYGVSVLFKDDAQGIMNGDEARTYLKEQFNYVSNKGAHRLSRGGDGYWSAANAYLANSGDYGRVDFASGEATAKNLESAVLSDFNRIAKAETDKLNARIRMARDAAVKTLQG